MVKSLLSLSVSRERQVRVVGVYFAMGSVRECVLGEVGRKYRGDEGEPVGWMVEEGEIVRERVCAMMSGCWWG